MLFINKCLGGIVVVIMKLVKVACPQCGGTVEVDKNFETARCPFCNSSFVIEDSHSVDDKEPVYATTLSECDAKDVKKELEIYSLFGWDFKERKTFRVEDKKIHYTDGTSKTTYKDINQITFQRNVKASWCTKELLSKEKEYFKIRKEYKDELKKHDNVNTTLLSMYKDAKNDKKQLITIGCSFGPSLILSLVFFAIYLSRFQPVFGIISLVFFVLSIGFIVFFALINNEENKEQKQKFGNALQKKEEEYYEAQKERLLKMNEIATWAGEQMEAKFGYKLVPSLEDSNIELFKLKK